MNLNQQQAVNHTDGPLIIIAGAGTGKTRVITNKILHLINDKNISPRNILALTFSNRASVEMQDRVNESLSTYFYDLEINTFHSFCSTILREYGSQIGIPSNYVLLDDVGVVLFLRKIYDKLNLNYYNSLSSPFSILNDFKQFFSRAKDEVVLPEDFKKYVEEKEKEFIEKDKSLNEEDKICLETELLELKERAGIYKIYQGEMLKNGNLDFNDLIIYTILLFQKRPQILAKFQERFKYILVDEFQDTNIAQIELLRLLSSKYSNITVVGDDDQSIYHFRGASYASFEIFNNFFKDTNKITLNQNYRTTKKILSLTNDLIDLNAESRFDPHKKLFTENSEGDNITLLIGEDYDSEAYGVVEEIKNIYNKQAENNKSWKDFAILYRSHSHKDKVIDYLKKSTVPYQIKGKIDIFSDPAIKDFIAYLKIIYNPDDNISLFRILSFPNWNFSWDDKIYLNNLAKENDLSLFKAIDLMEKTKDLFGNIKNLIGQLHNNSYTSTLYEIFGEVIKANKIFEDISIREFWTFVSDYLDNNQDACLKDFLDYIEVFQELGGTIATDNFSENQDAVQLMTIHSSKGLEFPYVFVIGINSRRFPGAKRPDSIPLPDELMKETLPEGDYHIQEERRLFYVASTRACKQLYLTCIDKKGTPPSNFFKEAKHIAETNKISNEKQIRISDDSRIVLTKKLLEEKDKYIPKIDFNTFSYTQIETYMDCPLKYKYRYIIKIPLPPNPVFIYGSIMHSTLEEFYLRIKNGEDPQMEDLENIFNQKWEPKGFRNKFAIEKHKFVGLTQLREFYIKNKPLNPEPLMLEQKFTINIEDFKIIGRIDRIDILNKDKTVEIIDYKTGKPKDQKTVDKDQQLSIYAIACEEVLNLNPSVLSFYYLSNNQKVSSQRIEKDILKTKKTILETVTNIRKQEFSPSPSSFKCKKCDFKNFCNFS